ncbi:MAG: nicotinate (nicotinamide) nucleotide adenylyltransferase [Bacteroidales bacterium]|jgi:nicotinate-nucleotide adenylyltransferase|nr:nicotinate (nicotinamide) nucleotide adenylyltransferase [Bacteroidales bacterium]
MKIAVYSGSFNPLHIGHQRIMEYLTREKDFDWVYLVVSPKNPIKDTVNSDSAKDRYYAAIDAVKRHPDLHVWVDDIELNMPPPQYTIKTLDALKRREPDNEFTLVIGADNLYNIHMWRDFQRILTEYGVAVYPRAGFDLAKLTALLLDECRKMPSPYVLDEYDTRKTEGMIGLEDALDHAYNIKILDAPIVDVSSTEIREGIASGKNMDEYLM